MRTLALSLATAMTVAGASSAQELFEIYPGNTSFGSRGDVPASATGEVHQGFHSQVIRGLGDANGVCLVRGARCILQDQAANTTERYRVVLRSGTDAAGPNPLPTGILAQSPLLLLPTATVTSAASWIVTLTFATPVVVPCDGFWSLGIELTPESAPGDYISVHTSIDVLHAQHAQSVDMAWQIVAGVTSHPAQKRSWRVAPIVGTSLQAANVDGASPLFHLGNGGFFPDTSLTSAGRSQGLAFAVMHPNHATGVAVVFTSVSGFTAAPFTVPGVINRIYLDLGGLMPFVVSTGAPDASHRATLPFLSSGGRALPSAAGRMITFQAVVTDPSNGSAEFTNAVGVVLH